MNRVYKTACVGSECVACGCCVTACPKAAIRIEYGVTAKVDPSACVGCGKCAKVCPAAVITILEQERG